VRPTCSSYRFEFDSREPWDTCWTFPVTHRNFYLARAAKRKSVVAIWIYLYRVSTKAPKRVAKTRIAIHLRITWIREDSLSLSRARAIDESFSAKKTREIRSILDQRHPALLQLSRVTCSTCYLGQRTTFERHSVSSTRATRCEGMPSVPFLFLVWIQKFVSARATRNLSLPTRLRYQTDSSSTELTQLSRRIMSQNRTKRNRSGWWNEATRNLSPDLPDDRQDFPKLIYAETRIAKHRSRTRRAHRLSPSEYRASAVPITTRPNLWGTFDIIARAISS